MLIDYASPDDAAGLADLGARTFTDKFGHLYRPEDLSSFLDETHSLAAWENLLSDAQNKVWVARNERRRLVAYGMVGPVSLPIDGSDSADAVELKRLYVDQSAQGQGLGTRMLELMLDWIDRDGKPPIYLSVYKYNDGAQRLYERYGFRFLKEITFKVGDHYDPEYLYGRTIERLGAEDHAESERLGNAE